MVTTNDWKLPAPIVRAITRQTYSGAGEEKWASVTDLLKPPYMWALSKKLAAEGVELKSDVMDNFWMFIGNGVHRLIEEANEGRDDCLVEQRFKAEFNGRVITGGLDYYNPSTGELIDYKTSSGTAINKAQMQWDDKLPGSKAQEWHIQLNLYAWLLRQNGYNPQSLKIIAIARDWHMIPAMHGKKPMLPINELESPMRTDSAIEGWIRARMQAFEMAEAGEFSDCPEEALWGDPEHYKVKSPRAPKAARRLPTYVEAEQYLEKNRAKMLEKKQGEPEIIHAPATRMRCEYYCKLAPHCPGYQAWLGEQRGEAAE